MSVPYPIVYCPDGATRHRLTCDLMALGYGRVGRLVYREIVESHALIPDEYPAVMVSPSRNLFNISGYSVKPPQTPPNGTIWMNSPAHMLAYLKRHKLPAS